MAVHRRPASLRPRCTRGSSQSIICPNDDVITGFDPINEEGEARMARMMRKRSAYRKLAVKPKENRPYGRNRRRCRIIFKLP
jgi:hypothetical protein